MTAPRVCAECGAPVYPGVNFCTSCGAYQGWTEPAENAPAEHSAAGPRKPATPPPRSATSTPTAPPSPAVPTPSAAAPALGTLSYDPAATRSGPRAVGERPCPNCETGNPSTTRFCRKCGYLLRDRQVLTPTNAASGRLPWWRRWFGGRTDADREAHRNYRRSLPVWVRLRRYVAAIGVLVLALLYFRVVGRDPVAWVRHRIDDLRGTLVAVTGVRVAADPARAVIPGDPPQAAIDGRADTAWATVLLGGQQPAGQPCGASGQQAALLMTLPSTITVRALDVRAGLDGTDPQRPQFWRPKVLDLSFSDGSCQREYLTDAPAWQKITLRPVATNAVRVSIVAGYPANAAPGPRYVHLAEIRLLRRPG